METDNAKIIISVTEGKFEISGSEEFVTKQIENFKDLITKSVGSIPTPNKTVQQPIQTNNSERTETNNGGTNGLDKYPDIYALDGEDIKVICDIPGSNVAKQAYCAALLLAFGKKQLGHDEVLVEEIKEICKSHGCYDGTNFSTHMKKGNPKQYIDKGSGKTRSLRLNRPGEKEAEEFIKTITQNAG